MTTKKPKPKYKTPSYLAIDTETGGLIPGKNALLTVAFVLLDKNLNELDHLHLKLKSNNLLIEEKAITVNKIDITKHNIAAKTNLEAAKEFYFWIKKYFPKEPEFIKKLIPIGHNFSFDYGFIRANFTEIDLHPYISHNPIDTCSNVQLMKILGLIPKNSHATLSVAVKKAGIKDVSKAHDALVDTRLCIELLKWQLKTIKENYK